jgi:hypothetical protein
MSDLLSASSLLMAIAAILFSLWYADIAKALEISPRPYQEDNIGNLQTIKRVLYSKAVPVAIMATLVAIIFIPDAIRLCIDSWKLNQKSSWKEFFAAYDAVRTAYCYVSFLSLALAIYMGNLVLKLVTLKRALAQQ